MKIIAAQEKYTDIQLLRLTGPIKAFIANGDNAECKFDIRNRIETMEMTKIKMKNNHEKSKTKLEKEKRRLCRNIKDRLKDNSDMLTELESLRDEVVKIENLHAEKIEVRGENSFIFNLIVALLQLSSH